MDIRIDQLGKDFGGFTALRGVDLDIAGGELLALLGPSGSGKTTLLRAIAGLLQPDRGRILFGGRDASELSLRERRVGLVFQHYALFGHMSVAENIAFGLRCRPRRERPAEAEIRRRVEELIGRMQLDGLGGRLPHQLSGGQKQRVALARALAIEPSVLLLDEPFGALDAKVRVDLRRWLRRIHDDTGHTTVFVTHDQIEALELADRVAIFREGAIEQVGTAAELEASPRSAFVFGFLGPTSALQGQVRDGRFHPDGLGPALSLPAVIDATGTSQLLARPHQWRLVPREQGVPATVRALRLHAGRGLLEAEWDAQRGAVEIELDQDGLRQAPRAGERVGLLPVDYRVFPQGAAA